MSTTSVETASITAAQSKIQSASGAIGSIALPGFIERLATIMPGSVTAGQAEDSSTRALNAQVTLSKSLAGLAAALGVAAANYQSAESQNTSNVK